MSSGRLSLFRMARVVVEKKIFAVCLADGEYLFYNYFEMK